MAKKSRSPKEQRTYERKKRWRQENPEKARASVEDFYKRNPGAKRNRHLVRSYGMTKEEFHTLLASQGGECAICPSTDPQRKFGNFVVDHCHTTGKVRGLLCHRCNVALALANDDPDLLRAMASYL